MLLKNLLSKVINSENPYSPSVKELIRQTNYISWRNYLRKATRYKIPLFLKLLGNVDRSTNLPLYEVVEKLFLNDYHTEHGNNESIYIPSCYRCSSLPPVGLLIVSLYSLGKGETTTNPKIPRLIHELGYASELIQIAFEIHKSVESVLSDKFVPATPDHLLMNNKYAILLGDYLHAESSGILGSLKLPPVVGCMSQCIMDYSHSIAENSMNDATPILMCDYDRWKQFGGSIPMIGSSLPYGFQSVEYILGRHSNNIKPTLNKDDFYKFGDDLNNLIRLKYIYWELDKLKRDNSTSNVAFLDDRFIVNQRTPQDTFITANGLSYLKNNLKNSSSNISPDNKFCTIDLLMNNCVRKRSELISWLCNYLDNISPDNSNIKTFYKNFIQF